MTSNCGVVVFLQLETASSPVHLPSHQDASTETCSVGVNTESEFLGPCEPGTSVTLQGIVWQEQTDNGQSSASLC